MPAFQSCFSVYLKRLNYLADDDVLDFVLQSANCEKGPVFSFDEMLLTLDILKNRHL